MIEPVYGGPEGNPLSPHNREREEAKHRAEMVWKAAKHDEAVARAESLQRQVSEYREAASKLVRALQDASNYHWGPQGQICECEECDQKREALRSYARAALTSSSTPEQGE